MTQNHLEQSTKTMKVSKTTLNTSNMKQKQFHMDRIIEHDMIACTYVIQMHELTMQPLPSYPKNRQDLRIKTADQQQWSIHMHLH